MRSSASHAAALAAALVAAGCLAAPATSAQGSRDAATDSARVVSVLERFHAALEAGDSTAALALLAPDAVVLEAGAAETRAQYRAHHLAADIAYARSVEQRRTARRVTLAEDVAWAHTTTETRGTFRDRPVDAVGAELAVLRMDAEGAWRIVALHWSSRSRTPR